MDRLELLAHAGDDFRARLALVVDDDWTRPTPCEEWDVRGLVNHLVTADSTTVRLLAGATRDDVVALIGTDHLGSDAMASCAAVAAEQIEAFRAPGALERIVPHPAFDMPGSQLLDFRIGDTLLHTWDLARAIDADDRLDPELVEFVWQSLEPLADLLPASGAFGAGRSEAVSVDLPLQDRLLDLSGRRTSLSRRENT
jgi:uncharacterized protein (TIGR03086 family)